MSAEERKEEENKILGPDVIEAETTEAKVSEVGKNVPNVEVAWSNADGGSKSSIAPSLDGVSDTEGISIAEKIAIEKDPPEKKFNFPKIFIRKDELIEIEVQIVFDPWSGDIYSITQPGLLNTDILETLKAVSFYYSFRPVSYDDMQKYRRQASIYDANAGELIVNRLQLRNLFLINHLRETNMVDEYGDAVIIKIDPESDNLSLESLTQMFNTTPALLDVVMTLFERKLLLLFNVSQ